ncbi:MULTISPECIES: hypothetical protein [unclassified Streptomyces]|uniref:hypothetical protein n=1 Tax=unclassified Streptomyces TaxID=2593676 RepID=UPI0027E42213|nr:MULTISPECIES: hypothetical protein [unclassified Streptomyces]
MPAPTSPGACTGIRTTVPHEPHPTSGCGHSLSRPQDAHRAVTQLSDQVRWVSGTAGAAKSSGGVTGLPQAHGKTGAV